MIVRSSYLPYNQGGTSPKEFEYNLNATIPREERWTSYSSVIPMHTAVYEGIATSTDEVSHS